MCGTPAATRVLGCFSEERGLHRSLEIATDLTNLERSPLLEASLLCLMRPKCKSCSPTKIDPLNDASVMVALFSIYSQDGMYASQHYFHSFSQNFTENAFFRRRTALRHRVMQATIRSTSPPEV